MESHSRFVNINRAYRLRTLHVLTHEARLFISQRPKNDLLVSYFSTLAFPLPRRSVVASTGYELINEARRERNKSFIHFRARECACPLTSLLHAVETRARRRHASRQTSRVIPKITLTHDRSISRGSRDRAARRAADERQLSTFSFSRWKLTCCRCRNVESLHNVTVSG